MNRKRLLAAIVAGSFLMGTACDRKKETKPTTVTTESTSETATEPTTTETSSSSTTETTPAEDPILPIEGDGTLWNAFREKIGEFHAADPKLQFALEPKDPDDASSFHSLLVKEGEEVSEYAFSSQNEFVFQKKYAYSELSEFMAFHSYEEIMSLPLFPSKPMLDKPILSKEDVATDIYLGSVIGVKKDGTQVLVNLSSYHPCPEWDKPGYILSEYFETKLVVVDDFWDDKQNERVLLTAWLNDPKIDETTGLVDKSELNIFRTWGIGIDRKTTGEHLSAGKERGLVVLDLASACEFGDFDIRKADDTALDGYHLFQTGTTKKVTESFFWYSITHDLSGHVSDPRYTGAINSDDWYVVDVHSQDELLVISNGYLWFIY